ncbi:MAG: NAD(P)(+) transhydrogenase (Re/Si-specific) subunit beta, partial [Vulcanimicrobiaceae bacterium]
MSAEAVGNVWIGFAYLVTGVCFILGLRYLSSPRTARLGNRIAMLGMLIALVATAIQLYPGSWPIIVIGVAIGATAGIYSARAVRMTAMPQMVAIFNGMGGGAAAMVATAEFLTLLDGALAPTPDQTFTIVLTTVIGAISFAGSIIAFLKL